MDWGNDYFTFSDTNIEYIWRFLKRRARARLALPGPPGDGVVPALRHLALPARADQSGVYQERSDPSLSVRFPLLDRPGESLVIWTTTPWTLPANVAAAVNPEAEYGRREAASGSPRRGPAHGTSPTRSSTAALPGAELVGLRYQGPFDDARPWRPASSTGSSRWDEVSLEEGTGIVHIAPGCGGEDFELGRALGPCRC